jgi:hypothetical protein
MTMTKVIVQVPQFMLQFPHLGDSSNSVYLKYNDLTSQNETNYYKENLHYVNQ